ncbi:MAG: hypothetical protein J6334_05830 [Kiritimatiellae bacterium]|nr:hypothetical protein [Kiritimatiellia bacterium]
MQTSDEMAASASSNKAQDAQEQLEEASPKKSECAKRFWELVVIFYFLSLITSLSLSGSSFVAVLVASVAVFLLHPIGSSLVVASFVCRCVSHFTGVKTLRPATDAIFLLAGCLFPVMHLILVAIFVTSENRKEAKICLGLLLTSFLCACYFLVETDFIRWFS